MASGAPITDCKKAISEVGDDLDAAFEWLRKKGAARASEKSGRATQHVRLRKPRQWRARSLAESHTFFRAQGLVGALVAENGTHAVLVEVNSETDFVARNEHFQRFVADVAASASARVEGGADGPAVEPLSIASTLNGKYVLEMGELANAVKQLLLESVVRRKVDPLALGPGWGLMVAWLQKVHYHNLRSLKFMKQWRSRIVNRERPCVPLEEGQPTPESQLE